MCLPRKEGLLLPNSVVWTNYWFCSNNSHPHPCGVSSECWFCLSKKLARILNRGLLICVGLWESSYSGGRTCSEYECAFSMIPCSCVINPNKCNRSPHRQSGAARSRWGFEISRCLWLEGGREKKMLQPSNLACVHPFSDGVMLYLLLRYFATVYLYQLRVLQAKLSNKQT